MEAIIYFLIFVMGAFFGSFFTLAVYRLPIGEDITHKHSFCPNCHHKLGFFDLFPIFSYIFLGGKCRYCKKPIRIRYFLLEVLSGFTFLAFALSLRFDFYQIEISKYIYFAFSILYICSLFIIAGIDKEKRTIQKSVFCFGLVVVTIYILYLYIVENANIYRYVIYLAIMLLIAIIETILLRKKAKSYYPLQVVNLCIYMGIFTGEEVLMLTVIYTLLAVALSLLFHKIFYHKKKVDISTLDHIEKQEVEPKQAEIPIGFYLCITNMILLIFTQFIIHYV